MDPEWSSCVMFMMAHFRGTFFPLLQGFGGFIEIFDEGGDASNNEKRRNIASFSYLRKFLKNINTSQSFIENAKKLK
jgi:hypothetical protein